MKRKILFPFICIVVFISRYGYSQEVRELTGPDVVPAVYGIVEVPTTDGLHPSVLILHGSGGWNPAYDYVAETLSDSGFVGLTIDLYAVAGPPNMEDPQSTAALWPQYMETVRNAVAFLRSLPSSKGQPVGIIGLSMGSLLAISVGNSTDGIGAVVEYFGPTIDYMEGNMLENATKNFPPLLILHGETDTDVPVSNAYALQKALLSNDGEVEMYIYPNAGHAFNLPGNPNYIETASIDAWNKTFSFLNKWLKDNK